MLLVSFLINEESKCILMSIAHAYNSTIAQVPWSKLFRVLRPHSPFLVSMEGIFLQVDSKSRIGYNSAFMIKGRVFADFFYNESTLFENSYFFTYSISYVSHGFLFFLSPPLFLLFSLSSFLSSPLFLLLFSSL